MNKRLLKKKEIIKNSINVMFHNGYNNTGVKDLTDAAGIPKGSLYNYFANKEDYAKEALTYYYREMSFEVFQILEGEELPPLDRIKNFYKKMISSYSDGEQCRYGCFAGNLTQEMAGISDEISDVTQKIHDEIAGKIKKCLEEAVHAGEMSGKKDLQVLADFIVSSWQGSLLRIKASRNKEILDEFYQVLVEILLK